MHRNYCTIVKEMFANYLRRTFKGRRKPVIFSKTLDVWDLLASEGNSSLINTLHHVESHDGGYGTIIIPDGGFSIKPTTHKAVMRFLKKHKVNTFNVKNEVHHLQNALCL